MVKKDLKFTCVYVIIRPALPARCFAPFFHICSITSAFSLWTPECTAFMLIITIRFDRQNWRLSWNFNYLRRLSNRSLKYLNEHFEIFQNFSFSTFIHLTLMIIRKLIRIDDPPSFTFSSLLSSTVILSLIYIEWPD